MNSHPAPVRNKEQDVRHMAGGGQATAAGGQAAGGGGRGPSAAAANSSSANAGGGENRLAILLELEGALRRLPDRRAVEIFAVNEFRRLLSFSQAAFISVDARGRARISAFSGLVQVDRQAPLVRALERLANRLLAQSAKCDTRRGDMLMEANGRLAAELREWAFPHFLWHVLRDRTGRPIGALLFMRAEPWREADEVVGARLAEAVAQAILALAPRSVLDRVHIPRWAWWVVPLALLALLLIPVPMTAVAPVEVVADRPFPVTAPMDGVIARVPVEPNTPVTKGQTLFLFDDTQLKAQAEVAARREAVALAKLATLRKAAFADPNARQKLAEAQAELELARAEREHAQELLSRVQVRAARDGIVIFADKARLIGKPVQTGERVMEIADPAQVTFRIDLPVSDAIAIKEGGKVRVFLDADPLRSIPAKVRWASFHAEEVPGGLLAFRVIADPVAESEREKAELQRLLRIGFRGSAQVYGETVPLGFYLFRRPIAAVRQFLGW